MISTSDFKKGLIIKYESQPWIILEYQFLKPGKGGAFMQTKLKNLKTNTKRDISFKSTEKFEELDVEKKEAKYIYHNKKEVFFNNSDKKRFSLPIDIFNDKLKYLKQDIKIDIIYIEEEPVSFEIPIKIPYLVKEAPGAAKGNTASGAMKKVVLENGLEIDVPMFINQDDTIIVNTDKCEYSERG